MKRIILPLLLTTSVMLLAKTEEPKAKSDEIKNKEETILIAKKNFKDEKVIKIEIKKAFFPKVMDSQTCYIIVSALATIPPNIPNYSLCDALADAGF
jgi:hypothetical protein